MSDRAPVHITLVRLKNPCNACIIVGRLLIESIERACRERPDVEFTETELADIRDAAKVPGVEIERFPAILLNGEQVTAGSMITPRELLKLMESRG